MRTGTMKKKIPLNREQAIKVVLKIIEKDDPYWDYIVEEFYDEESDSWPTIDEVFEGLGISKEEVHKIEFPTPTGRAE